MATCEWVIDIIQEWADARFLQPPIFVDRGDPVNADFVTGDFTRDSAFHDLDLSAIVPEGAKAVLTILYLSNTFVNRTARFRKSGNVNAANESQITIQVANIPIRNDLVCPLPANRHIDYYFTAGGWTGIFLTVKGWWL